MPLPEGKKIKKHKGFSILEVILAAFVLSVGLAATANLMANSIYHSADSRNQIIASELAQEGIELVNNIRDNNWASGSDAFHYPPFPTTPAVCTVSYNYNYSTGSGINCVNPDPILYYSPSNFYLHGSTNGTPTKFQRKITVADDVPPRDISNKKITSIVIWGGAWPVAVDLSDCNTAKKCTYSETVLSSTNYH